MSTHTGQLTTHVLDTGQGLPGRGMKIELLYYGEATSRTDKGSLLIETTTNEDGRTDQPLLQGEAVRTGIYELRFYAAAYLEDTRHSSGAHIALWDWIPIRFHIRDSHQHYHIPLLLAPGGYSTYRGS